MGPRRHRSGGNGCGIGAIPVLAALVVLAGCGRTMVASRLRTDYTPRDLSSDMSFWHSLPERPVVANDEALHGLIVLEAGSDSARGYEERVAWARSKRWVGADWNEPAEEAVQRGVVATAVCRVCGIEGGVIMRLVGPAPRYALRELVYQGIMVDSSEQQAISGTEFLGVVSKAQDYLTLKKAEAAQGPGSVRTPGT